MDEPRYVDLAAAAADDLLRDLRLPDGTRLLPEGLEEGTKVKEPALQSMNPLPGECGRGSVTFQTPRDERPEIVLYEEQFVLKDTIAWKVPKKR